VGLADDVGVLEAGRLADIIILTRDPLADVRVLQGGRHLARIIKDGKTVALRDRAPEDKLLALERRSATS
jgi:imidazolonepropionase-like amidohydrolase